MFDKLRTSLAALGIAIAPALLEFAQVSNEDGQVEEDETAAVKCVGHDQAPVHERYRGSGDVNAKLDPGAVVQVLSKRKTWRHVVYVDGDRAETGWVLSRYLGDCDGS